MYYGLDPVGPGRAYKIRLPDMVVPIMKLDFSIIIKT